MTITYATAVKRGLSAVKTAGKTNWLLGDIASDVEPKYGEKTVHNLADAINVDYKTLLGFRTTAQDYPADKRTDNPWTVHYIFNGLADRHELLARTEPWTVSQARAEITARKNATEVPDGDDAGDGDSTSEAVVSELDKARANVARLEGELVKARAALAKLESAETPAVPKMTEPSDAKTSKPRTSRASRASDTHSEAEKAAARVTAPASDVHVVRGVPSHDASANRADCSKCKKAGSATVTQITGRQVTGRKRSA
jgi:hypothetical protein